MNNKLHITRWAFDLSTWTPTLNQLTQAVAVVQPEERNRLIRFYFINDFLSSLVGRLLMRKYVRQCCNLPYTEIKFARDSKGKPYWVRNEVPDDFHAPAISFNVSHQGKFVILAGVVSNAFTEFSDFGIGCDVMKLEYSGGKDLQEFFRIMNKKFSDSEWRSIKQPHFNQHQQVKAFMRHWCLKESYVKELGVGLAADLQKIVFTVGSNDDFSLESQPLCGSTLKCNDLPMNQWCFEEHILHSKYCAAIACRNFKPEAVDKFQLLQITELLQATAAQNDEDVIDYCQNVLNKPKK